MKNAIRRFVSLLLCMLLLAPAALADQSYLIPDSDTRHLTEKELWEWDYESLGFIYHEIFARHGFIFNPGGQYYYYFNCMPWYKPNTHVTIETQRAYYGCSQVEIDNVHLIKQVRAEMERTGNHNPNGRSVWDNFSSGFDVLQGFEYVSVKADQRWPVYSAPSTSAWRGANGKAMVNTTGYVYAAGWENGWLLVMYETNNGSVRVGYVHNTDMNKAPTTSLPYLNFDYSTATVTRQCSLTDDPARCFEAITTLSAGKKVTYLTSFFNRQPWAYVETTVGSTTVRGFIPASCLDVSSPTKDDFGI
ncbi:MAG: YARHG domain-containing protein [Aristaeellaceae bacterium]